jgi:hypothetical protein
MPKSKKDPYMSRNEFKKGFYDQKSKPPTTAETMHGKGTNKFLEEPIVDPDSKMVQDSQGMVEGGFARGQKPIQVKKVPFRGVF